MKNWLGHDIVEGAVVFRGGKQGTSSSFRIGFVELLRPEKSIARVEWKWASSGVTIWFGEAPYSYPPDPRNYTINGPRPAMTKRTSYNINELVRVDDNMLKYLEKRNALIDAAQRLKVSKSDFTQFEEDFMAGKLPI